ncbi:MAG: FtsX protein [Thermodesulfobacteriota bacterium]|nr:FtsX protein [Thermodesulfobacteriota bacterium]
MPFLFWIKTASLFLVRSRRSTAVLILMIFSAVSTLIFLASLAVGINDAMIRNSVSLYSGHISGFNLPVNVRIKSLFTDGVSNVLMRIPVPGVVSYSGKMAAVTLIAVDPVEEKKSTAVWKKIIKGKYLEPGKNQILLSKSVAEQLNAGPGETIVFSPDHDSPPVQLALTGIYNTGIYQLDRDIAFCQIAALPSKAAYWNAAIFLNDAADKDLILAGYNKAYLKKSLFKTWSDLMPDLKQLIDLNYISMSIVMVLVFGVVSLGIACAFSIFILKNIREYGIMKAMGVSPYETLLLIFSEVILLNLTASFMGIIGGIAAVLMFQKTGIDLSVYTSHNQYFIVSGVIFPRLTAYSVWLAPCLALVFSVFAAIWPATLVIRTNTSRILRSI